MMKKIWLTIALATSMTTAGMANAAVVTKHYEVTSTFATGPNSKVVTAFDVTFDAASKDPSVTLTIQNYSSTGGSPFANAGANYYYSPSFTTWHTVPESRSINLYGTYDATYFNQNTDDFTLVFQIDDSGNIVSGKSSTAYATASGGYYNGTLSVVASTPAPTITPDPIAALPEPANWATMLLGFAMVAGTTRYRRRRVAVVFG
jgi:hypothetical protein